MKITLLFKSLLFITLCNVLHAEPGDVHVHGLAELTVAFENNKLELHVESPAANIVGFEHKASTPQQRDIVDKAKMTLESPQKLFSFSGTSCSLEDVHTDFSALKNTHKHHHDEKQHKAHNHHKNHHQHEKSNTHSEVTATYHFNCQPGSKLTSLSVNLFDYFTGLEKLNAIWVTDTQQGSAKLTVLSKTIYLR